MMNKEILQDALLSALSLLNSEFETVEDAELNENYLQVIEKIENGLKELI
ncbi:MAG: hypothetical protein ABIN91_22055 [Mucilaginibacter sp.]